MAVIDKIGSSSSGPMTSTSAISGRSGNTATAIASDRGEFVCFLSTIITSRILKRFDSAGTFDGISYGKSMKVLERAKKVHIDNERKLIRLSVKDSDILTELGLIPKIITVKNPRGRPSKKRL